MKILTTLVENLKMGFNSSAVIIKPVIMNQSLWEDLPNCQVPLLIVHGEMDMKFKKIAEAMMNTLCSGLGSKHEEGNDIHEVFEVPKCGHAAHLENPLPIIDALRQFMTRL
ncbi:putative 2-succinyl-5-enolpyruvyl-6-hydroxy-3-cyclohexene-1-carboxylic-acid synthase [Lupinus albus]|uniref:Putative 2-succinyl-5-enolpyruvyl-6-hydroxy-3-cyclohexene-1-carboxylic-acid synthase n=1 Tax=Lupinus albus TaxID=3870 RepID=A0A6A4P7V8_LUPAL|nr:putative 2-succinyl-5-enolpyruvyl-6-hydroxy-3-cyclohexene-1-carboxylic-acid synthase [Lupinus albus]